MSFSLPLDDSIRDAAEKQVAKSGLMLCSFEPLSAQNALIQPTALKKWKLSSDIATYLGA